MGSCRVRVVLRIGSSCPVVPIVNVREASSMKCRKRPSSLRVLIGCTGKSDEAILGDVIAACGGRSRASDSHGCDHICPRSVGGPWGMRSAFTSPLRSATALRAREIKGAILFVPSSTRIGSSTPALSWKPRREAPTLQKKPGLFRCARTPLRSSILASGPWAE